MTVADPSAGGRARLPRRRISLSQLAAYNLAAYRKAAGLSQQEFGERMGGWSAASVSAAERSWDSRRIRKFDADELVRIAAVLGVPLAALFVPPEDSGTAVHYVLDPPLPGETGAELSALLPHLVTDYSSEPGSPVMDEYRRRLIAAGIRPPDGSLDKSLYILAEAQRVADTVIDATRRESDETLARARRQAEQLTGDASLRARALELDAQERHRQAMVDLVVQREELERRVNDLRAFERAYHGRLRALLENQYRYLVGAAENIDVDELLDAMRRQAGERGAHIVTAVLLGDDGTYDILRSDQAQDAADRQDEDEDGYGNISGYGGVPREDGQ